MKIRKNMYDIITNPPKEHRHARLIAPVIGAVALAFLAVFRLTRGNTALMQRIIDGVTTPYKNRLSAACAHLPFNIAEIVWTVAVLGLVAFVVFTVWQLVTEEDRVRRLLRRCVALIAAALVVYSGYTALWGINYYGETFSQRSGLAERGCTVEELYTLTVALADYANGLSDQMPRNAAGEMEMDGTLLLRESCAAFANAQQEFPFLEGSVTVARPMFYSKVMSWMGFTGFLFPFTGESLVNVDQPVCLTPATALHELAHQRSVAGENEANFVAIVAGFRSENAMYAYSSALLGYIHVGNALYSADRALWQEARSHLNEQVLADLAANNRYWASFESPVETATKKVYNEFLESYEQKDGIESYGRCVDLLAAYYFELHPDYLSSGKL